MTKPLTDEDLQEIKGLRKEEYSMAVLPYGVKRDRIIMAHISRLLDEIERLKRDAAINEMSGAIENALGELGYKKVLHKGPVR